jgi:hypothetical protein
MLLHQELATGKLDELLLLRADRPVSSTDMSPGIKVPRIDRLTEDAHVQETGLANLGDLPTRALYQAN